MKRRVDKVERERESTSNLPTSLFFQEVLQESSQKALETFLLAMLTVYIMAYGLSTLAAGDQIEECSLAEAQVQVVTATLLQVETGAR